MVELTPAHAKDEESNMLMAMRMGGSQMDLNKIHEDNLIRNMRRQQEEKGLFKPDNT